MTQSTKILCACCNTKRKVTYKPGGLLPSLCVQCWTDPENRQRWPATEAAPAAKFSPHRLLARMRAASANIAMPAPRIESVLQSLITPRKEST